MKIKVEKKVNEDKSVTVVIDFEQEIPPDLVSILEKYGITDSMNNTAISIDSYIKEGVEYGSISITNYP